MNIYALSARSHHNNVLQISSGCVSACTLKHFWCVVVRFFFLSFFGCITDAFFPHCIGVWCDFYAFLMLFTSDAPHFNFFSAHIYRNKIPFLIGSEDYNISFRCLLSVYLNSLHFLWQVSTGQEVKVNFPSRHTKLEKTLIFPLQYDKHSQEIYFNRMYRKSQEHIYLVLKTVILEP